MAYQTLLASAKDLVDAIDKGTVICQESAFVDSLRAAVEREMPRPNSDGWVSWSGGPCPVRPQDWIQIQLGDETKEEASSCGPSRDCQSLRWTWNHNGLGGDIIAYRIVERSHDNDIR